MLERWGADALRDSDGTKLDDEIKSLDAKIYTTYFVARGHNEFASLWLPINLKIQFLSNMQTIIRNTSNIQKMNHHVCKMHANVCFRLCMRKYLPWYFWFPWTKWYTTASRIMDFKQKPNGNITALQKAVALTNEMTDVVTLFWDMETTFRSMSEVWRIPISLYDAGWVLLHLLFIRHKVFTSISLIHSQEGDAIAREMKI